MERKQKCESIVLSREEKKLLAEIKRHPHESLAQHGIDKARHKWL